MLKEFKEFALRGNVLDLAVGVVLGSAFGAIVNSVVSDLLLPLIGLITGGHDFQTLFIALDGNYYTSLAEATEAGASVLPYGSFISAVVNFFLIALSLFIVVKIINRFMKKKEAVVVPARTCPFCTSEVALAATRCPHCTSQLN